MSPSAIPAGARAVRRRPPRHSAAHATAAPLSRTCALPPPSTAVSPAARSDAQKEAEPGNVSHRCITRSRAAGPQAMVALQARYATFALFKKGASGRRPLLHYLGRRFPFSSAKGRRPPPWRLPRPVRRPAPAARPPPQRFPPAAAPARARRAERGASGVRPPPLVHRVRV